MLKRIITAHLHIGRRQHIQHLASLVPWVYIAGIVAQVRRLRHTQTRINHFARFRERIPQAINNAWQWEGIIGAIAAVPHAGNDVHAFVFPLACIFTPLGLRAMRCFISQRSTVLVDVCSTAARSSIVAVA